MNNRDVAHVTITRWADAEAGQGHFTRGILAYDSALGPLRQTSLIDASAIAFHAWPARHRESIAWTTLVGGTTELLALDPNHRVMFLILKGRAELRIGRGESLPVAPGDVLELTANSLAYATLQPYGDDPVRASVIHLGKAGPAGLGNGGSPQVGGTTREISGAPLSFLRNVTGPDERSHFEDGELPYFLTDDGAQATEAIAINGFRFVLALADLNFDFHNAPQRQIVLPLTGGMIGENGDGTRRTVNTGDVYFGEDTTGQGHITRALNAEIRFSIFAHLA